MTQRYRLGCLALLATIAMFCMGAPRAMGSLPPLVVGTISSPRSALPFSTWSAVSDARALLATEF